MLLEQTLHGIEASWAKWLRGEINLFDAPPEIIEIMKRHEQKDVTPLSAVRRILKTLEGPTVLLRDRIKPHLADLIRKVRKESGRDHFQQNV